MPTDPLPRHRHQSWLVHGTCVAILAVVTPSLEPVESASLAVVTVPSATTPIELAVNAMTSILVPLGGAVLKVSVVPDTAYVPFSW